MKDQTKQNKTKISDRQINKIKAKTWLEFIKLAAPRISLLIGLIATLIILAILENISPLLIRFAIDHFIQNNLTDGLIIYSVIYLIIILIIAFCTKAYLKLSGRIETEMSYNIRKRGFEHLQNLSFSFYDRTPVGWLLSRMINDVTRLCEVIAFGLIDFVWGGFTIVVILIAMLFMNLRLGLIALIAFPVVIAMTIHFQKKMLRTQREIRRLNSVITGEFNEGIMGARTTKTLLREKENELEFLKLLAK